MTKTKEIKRLEEMIVELAYAIKGLKDENREDSGWKWFQDFNDKFFR